MKKLNKMPRSSYDAGKVLAYDVETSWIRVQENPCVRKQNMLTMRYSYYCDYVCGHDPMGYADCSIGSRETRCSGECP